MQNLYCCLTKESNPHYYTADMLVGWCVTVTESSTQLRKVLRRCEHYSMPFLKATMASVKAITASKKAKPASSVATAATTITGYTLPRNRQLSSASSSTSSD